MKIDLMAGAASWENTVSLARAIEEAGFSGMVFTETSNIPWMAIAASAMATTRLEFLTGITVAFARSPMVSAIAAWELAANSKGRFRLGLGSQVKAHIERRYGVAFDPPGPRLRDYVRAVKACFFSFETGEPLDYQGEFYKLTLLPKEWRPANHPYNDVKIDIAAVNPWMCRMAASVADGIHVHPLHTSHYLRERLMPAVEESTSNHGRKVSDISITIPVFVVPGDSPDERSQLLEKARSQIAFYGSTRNYSFQFDDLGFEGTSAKLNEKLKSGDTKAMSEIITDEILSHFAVIGPWSEIPQMLHDRYAGIATRIVMYLAEDSIASDPGALRRWGEIAKAVSQS